MLNIQKYNNFSPNQQDKLSQINEQLLGTDFYISWTNFKSIYLIDENKGEIARFSNHNKAVNYPNYISNNFQDLIKNLKKFLKENNIELIKLPKKESISKYLMRIKKEQEILQKK